MQHDTLWRWSLWPTCKPGRGRGCTRNAAPETQRHAVPSCPRRFLTGSIEEVSKGYGISQSFLGLIVLPIAGNACEHITAVFVAAKDKMDLAIGVALGSSIQVRYSITSSCHEI